MCHQLDCAGFTGRAAQQGAGLEGRAVGSKFEETGAAPRANDLQEAEAIHRSTFKGRGQVRVDGFGNGLTRGLAAYGWQVNADRSAYAVATNGPGSGYGAGDCELLRGQVAVDIDQCHRRS